VPVYAVDRSAAMLAQARRNCRAAGVCFLQQDLRCLRLPTPVDLITANFDTMNHVVRLADLREALGRVGENLRPGGHFYFDFVTPCQPLGGTRTHTRSACTPRGWWRQVTRREPCRRLLRIAVFQLRFGAPCPVVERFTERAYGPAEVGRAALEAGLVIRGVHDEATLLPALSCPPRLIVIARRPPRGTCPKNRAGSLPAPPPCPGTRRAGKAGSLPYFGRWAFRTRL
jgi:SAM-dependent methyltransferase